MLKFGHKKHNDCCIVWRLMSTEETNSMLCILLQFLDHPGGEPQHQLPTKNTACPIRNYSLFNAQGPCLSDKIMRNDRSHVPLHIVVAEICEDESLNDFGKKHHWWPQTIAQSSQQPATGIQNLQNRVIEAIRDRLTQKNLGFCKTQTFILPKPHILPKNQKDWGYSTDNYKANINEVVFQTN